MRPVSACFNAADTLHRGGGPGDQAQLAAVKAELQPKPVRLKVRIASKFDECCAEDFKKSTFFENSPCWFGTTVNNLSARRK
jgi:hypothetical protein